MSRVIAVIPSRIGSVRFPAKPLALIAGVPLITRVVRQVQRAKKVTDIAVATDHPEIARLAEAEGAKAVQTDSDLATGTDRVFQAVSRAYPAVPEDTVVLNVQGDEPLIDPTALDQLVARMLSQPQLEMGTIARPFTSDVIGLEEIENPMTAKVIVNKRNEAIYFSRHPIPFARMTAKSVLLEGALEAVRVDLQNEWLRSVYKHIGVYSFRLNFLSQFCHEKASAIELTEGLEQLRALKLGAKIGVEIVESDSWGVDTPEDVLKIEVKLRARE